MSHRLMSIAALVLALSTSAALAQSAPTEKTKIKHGWPAGLYTMTVADQTQTVTKVGDKDIKSQATETMTWEIDVQAPNDKGEKKMTLKLVRVVSTEKSDKETSFDSGKAAEGEDEGLAFVYKPLVGQPIQVMLDTDDTLVEVSGLDKFWKQLAEKAETPAQKEKLATIRVGLNDKGIEQELRRMETMMPREAVAVGDSWKAGMRVELPVVGEIKARYDCKLKAIDKADSGQQAVIECAGAYESTNPKASKVNGLDMTITKFQVQEKATVKVDVKTGLLQSDEKAITLTADITAKGEDGKDVSLTVKNTQTGKMTIEPKKETKPAN